MKKYAIESTISPLGWDSNFGFIENSEYFDTRSEAEQHLKWAKDYCDTHNYVDSFKNSLVICETDFEEEGMGDA